MSMGVLRYHAAQVRIAAVAERARVVLVERERASRPCCGTPESERQ